MHILGIRVDPVRYDSVVERITEASLERKSLSVAAFSVHSLMEGVLDRKHGVRLNALDINAPDGQPLRWALNCFYSTQLKERVYGPELMLRVCDSLNKHSIEDSSIGGVFLYGSTEKVLHALSQRLTIQYPYLRIAGAFAPRWNPFSESDYAEAIQRIKDSKAVVVFVGLGSPKQETWIHAMTQRLAMPLIAVGAAFDLHSGLKATAPTWMQRNGLEWLFRLFQEPKRLWKRYLLLNPLFIGLIVLQWMGLFPRSR
jgi:exopolysaccharide biosynthesis WecB/TagA/CpsF family protein